MNKSIVKRLSTRTIFMSVVVLLALVLMQQFVSADLKEKSDEAAVVQVTKKNIRQPIHTAFYNQFAISARH